MEEPERPRHPDEVYPLTANNGQNCLHGGENAFDQQIWEATVIMEDADKVKLSKFCKVDTKTQKDIEFKGVKFTRNSPAGENGFPHDLEVTVWYLLSDDDKLLMAWEAEVVDHEGRAKKAEQDKKDAEEKKIKEAKDAEEKKKKEEEEAARKEEEEAKKKIEEAKTEEEKAAEKEAAEKEAKEKEEAQKKEEEEKKKIEEAKTEEEKAAEKEAKEKEEA